MCDRLEALGAEVIVPGHGPVTDPSGIAEARAYLQFVQQVGAEGHASGATPLEVATATDLGAFAALSDSERLVGNLHRVYSELRGDARGAPLDLMVAAGDMVAYHGGPIQSHA